MGLPRERNRTPKQNDNRAEDSAMRVYWKQPNSANKNYRTDIPVGKYAAGSGFNLLVPQHRSSAVANNRSNQGPIGV